MQDTLENVHPSPELNAPDKAPAVRDMFAQIAPTYDRVNHILSASIDKRWRRLTVEALEDVLEQDSAIALDVCCGTGDLTLELAHKARVIGCDFCHPMLVIGRDKISSRGATRARLTEADALRLPFADQSFDAVTNAFGLRNLSNVHAGLAEMLRVLKPGGRAAVLEFSRPIVPLFREAFGFYFHRVLPHIGAILSGSRSAYTYLPESVNAFPDQKQLAGMMHEVGFKNVRFRNLSGGIAALHTGERII
jgi:demethylmenaquinone methyltransferase/2-methoxy-6-polyprenyl-1,4-benzoquinol methylase